MGATTFLRRGNGKLEGGQVADQWISPLLDASRGPMGMSLGRRGLRGGTNEVGFEKLVLYEDL